MTEKFIINFTAGYDISECGLEIEKKNELDYTRIERIMISRGHFNAATSLLWANCTVPRVTESTIEFIIKVLQCLQPRE